MKTFHDKRSLTLILSSLLGAILLSARAVLPATWSPEMAKVIEGAKKEGKLNLMWSQATLGGSQGAQMAQQALNKMFGTNIQIRFAPGPAMAQVGSQIATEYAAGQNAVSDVYLGAAAQVEPLVKRDVFQSVGWSKLLPGRITDEMTEINNRALRLGTGLSGVTYNTRLVPGGVVPKRLNDFLKPEWKGKIASTPYAASFDVLAANELWGPKKVLDFVRKLSGQIAGLMRCGEAERIATGEFIALVMDCTGQDAFVWQEKGAPLDQMIPADAAQERYYYFTLPKNAANPNAAKLYIAFMMTEEGQKLAWKTWKIDLHLFPESNLRRKIGKLEKEGVKFFEASIEWWMKNPQINKTKREMVKILTAGRKR
jgi:ABC-type Fe3+ transport system substrate-binding protein